MKVPSWRVVCILFCAVVAIAQGPPSPQSRVQNVTQKGKTSNQSLLHLVRVSTITAPADTATGFLAPLKCDNDGDLYFRQDGIDGVHRLNQKGEEVSTFQAASNTDKKIDGVASFAVGQDGTVYQLVMPHEVDRYIFAYKPDGALQSITKLNTSFILLPHSMAAFPTGQFLIAGSEYDRNHAEAKWPVTAIFAADGTLLKEVKLDDDETLHDMAASSDARVTMPGYPNMNRAVDLTQIEMAADGNAYLMRWTNPAIIYAISPGGEVVRRLKITPGMSGYRPAAMHIYKNRLAVLFVDPMSHEKVMKVLDLEGHALASYDEVRKDNKPQGLMLGSSFACYTEDPTRFVFLGANDNNRVQLWIAEPR